MNKYLIATIILIFAAATSATAATPDDYALHQINSTHWYFETTQNDLPTGIYDYQAFANNISSDYRILTVADSSTPGTPTNLANTTGNFWANHTWDSGGATSTFNVSINTVWHNSTAVTYNNTTVTAHAWVNITLAGYNSTTDSLSAFASQNTQIPNNAITITNTSDQNVNEGETVYVDCDATDPDTDTPTFSCNRTDLFADFSTATGKGNWTPFYNQSGVYYVDFGVSDGYGGTDNETVTVTVNDVTFNTALFSGWNLIAWIAETNGTAGEFAGIVTDAAYVSEKNATTGDYDNFNPAAPSINNFSTITGRGYYAQTTATAPFSRSRIDDVEYDTTLQSGWSIFGWTNISSMTAAQVVSDIGGNCQYLSTKNATTGDYDNFNPAAPSINNFNLVTGIAYYARTSSETIWTREA